MVVINRSLKPSSPVKSNAYAPMFFRIRSGAIHAPSIVGLKCCDFHNVVLPDAYKELKSNGTVLTHIMEYKLTPENSEYLVRYAGLIGYNFWYIYNNNVTKVNSSSDMNTVLSALEQILMSQGHVDVYFTEDILLDEPDIPVDIIFGNAFSNFTQLTGSLTMPKSLEGIGSQAFYNCTGLTSIIFNEGLKAIDASAFNGCTGLTGELVFPSTINRIGQTSFYGCRGVTSITLKATTPPTLENTAAIPDSVTKIYIPEGTLGTYQGATNWSSFFNLFDDGTGAGDSSGDDLGGDTGWNDGWNDDWGV